MEKLFWVDGARKPWWAVHLEGKLRFKTPRPHLWVRLPMLDLLKCE